MQRDAGDVEIFRVWGLEFLGFGVMGLWGSVGVWST